jgi:response regulator RpfG family c-di-GMP phosphodiesterase
MQRALNTPRLSGRIMVVSDRLAVVAELQAILRSSDHLALTVSDGDEALRILRDGVVPDVVISDLGCERSLAAMEYVWRFRQMNRVGSHLVVVEDGAPFSSPEAEECTRRHAVRPLPRPFHADEVREAIDEAIRRMDRDLRALRGETWREIDRLQQVAREVQRDTVNALAATIAARDPYMHGHAMRVAELCRRLGPPLGIRDEDEDVLETAARLHEIGKASVPVELLHKAEPLSTEELEWIRSHVRTGAEIVRMVPSLERVAKVIEHQATDYRDLERILGRGTADALLPGVLRVVDAYDAMTHSRAYRGATQREHWERTLTRGAGTTFHPGAVHALLRVLEPGGGDEELAA